MYIYQELRKDNSELGRRLVQCDTLAEAKELAFERIRIIANLDPSKSLVAPATVDGVVFFEQEGVLTWTHGPLTIRIEELPTAGEAISAPAAQEIIQEKTIDNLNVGLIVGFTPVDTDALAAALGGVLELPPPSADQAVAIIAMAAYFRRVADTSVLGIPPAAAGVLMAEVSEYIDILQSQADQRWSEL